MEAGLSSFELRKSDKRLKYRRGDKQGKRQHLGQLKLAVALIDFMNYVVTESNALFDLKMHMAYVGIAPGQYFGLILGMFPNLTIEAWDPHAMRIKDNIIIDPETGRTSPVTRSRLIFHKDLFRNSDVSALKASLSDHKKKGYVTIFISDIRREINAADSVGRVSAEKMIMEDMELQMEWAKAVKADFSQFKFRPPYGTIEHADGTRDTFTSIDYFPGKIRKQVFPPLLSTETRLISKLGDLKKLKNYDNLDYEEKCFFHNTKIREHTFPKEKFKNLRSSVRFDKFLRGHKYSFDAYWTMRTIADYVRKVRGNNWNSAEAKRLEPLLLDMFLELSMNPKKFAALAGRNVPLGAPSD